MGNRRKSRESALQILYSIDLGQLNPKEVSELFWKHQTRMPEIEEFAQELVDGVIRNQVEIDQMIEQHSTHWKLNRMACVDRNILRLAVFELLYCREIPRSVTLNEAIELGKRFGTEESGSFINGVLDHLAKEVKP
ncbi:MAG: transcription antitermination factor NusB [Deltaproteobacteria bacterium]|nr:transcription antitermination factor NusB [Deltaproteobacteria bacterium]